MASYSNAFNLQGQANGFSKVPDQHWWLAIQMLFISKNKLLMAFQKFPTKLMVIQMVFIYKDKLMAFQREEEE